MDRIRRLISERHRVLAGLIDSGFASLATFAIGIYAVRVLPPVELGGYALAYQALFLVQLIPANLVYAPAEIAVTAVPEADRVDHLPRSAALGLLPAALAALLVPLWALVAPPEIPAVAVRALTVTAVATAFLSPIQDHVRLILHSGGTSWSAAAMSTTQLLGAGTALAVLAGLGLGPAWVPFGALALANLASLTLGLVLALVHRSGPPAAGTRFRLPQLVRTGRWLVGGAILAPATGFAVAAIVSRLAGAGALGYAEAARVIAQPTWVLAVGLSAVLGPRLMEAGRAGDRDRGLRIARGFGAIVGAAGITALVVFGPAWSFNPLARLLPRAYVIPGLVAATILAQIANSVPFPLRLEALGAGREAALTRLEAVANALRAGIAATARATHAFAIPIGYLAVGIVRWIGYVRLRHRAPVSAAPNELAAVDDQDLPGHVR